MKHAILLTLLAITMGAGINEKPTTDKGRSANFRIEQALVEIDKQWGQATASGDLKALNRILADDLVAVGPKGELTDKKQQIEQAKSGSPVIKDSRYDADEYTVRMLSDSVAVMIHRGTYRSKDVYETHRSLHVFANRKGQWQVVATEQIPIASN